MAKRFVALDGIRGIAAISVMVFHVTSETDVTWLHRAWLSVDLFFCLSGFVVAHAYGDKIAAGMGLGVFLKSRLKRLAPVYIVGTLLGIVAAGVALLQGHEAVSGADFLMVSLMGLTLIPYWGSSQLPLFKGAGDGSLYPLNGPSWSLFFELFANLVYFFIAGRSTRFFLMLSAAALLVWAGTMWLGMSPHAGWSANNFVGGFPRVLFSFCMGVVCHRWHIATQRNLAPLAPWAVALMLLVFCLPESTVVTALSLVALGPLVVLTNAPARPSRQLEKTLAWMGLVSYPLYMIHAPLMRLWGECVHPYFHAPVWTENLMFMAAGLLGAHVLALAEQRWRRPTLGLAAASV